MTGQVSGRAHGVRIIGFYNPSVVLTYAGVSVAVLGLWLAASARQEAALICLVVAGLADLFDGPLARRVTRDAAARRFGQEIDSLADMVSFIALPVVIAMSLGVRSGWAVPVLAVYALAGVVRLAYFNAVTRGDASGDASGDAAAEPVRAFRGLPVTYAALILPAAALVAAALPASAMPWIVGVVLAALGALFVLDVPVPKPRGASYAVFGALAIAVVVALAFVDL